MMLEPVSPDSDLESPSDSILFSLEWCNLTAYIYIGLVINVKLGLVMNIM